MLKYLKENGYPLDLTFKTEPYEDKVEDFHGYSSDIFVDGVHYDTLIHSDYRARVHYASGFFAYHNWTTKGQYKWRGKEDPIRKDGILNVEICDMVVLKNGRVEMVRFDDDPDMPYELIERHATEKEAENATEINHLLGALECKKAGNKAAWDMYGSELCAGDMIGQEKALEEKIEELRHESKKSEV